VVIAFNKPYGVLSQFTPEPGSAWGTLAAYGMPAGVYPVGRLDADSEGLLVLTDEARFATEVFDGHVREYLVQVEGIPTEAALRRLESGVVIGGYTTRPARARRLDPPPAVGPRVPAIRVRRSIPDSWISLELTEGKNRQVRRMTAAVGHPTLRLVRSRIGALRLDQLGLAPGAWAAVNPATGAVITAPRRG
jgi:23S rRNA pseudouridine2457 synthase